MRLAGARDRVAAQRVDVEREADRRELASDRVDAVVRDAGDDEVLLARQADVAAERSARSAIAIIWSPEIRPRCTGTPM